MLRASRGGIASQWWCGMVGVVVRWVGKQTMNFAYDRTVVVWSTTIHIRICLIYFDGGFWARKEKRACLSMCACVCLKFGQHSKTGHSSRKIEHIGIGDRWSTEAGFKAMLPARIAVTGVCCNAETRYREMIMDSNFASAWVITTQLTFYSTNNREFEQIPLNWSLKLPLNFTRDAPRSLMQHNQLLAICRAK